MNLVNIKNNVYNKFVTSFMVDVYFDHILTHIKILMSTTLTVTSVLNTKRKETKNLNKIIINK